MSSPPPVRHPGWSRHLPAVAWSLIVAWLLLLPADAADFGSWSGFDKPLHALLFAVQQQLIERSLRPAGYRRPALAAAALALLWGLALEAAQSVVPGRHASLGDMAANLAGIALAALLASAWRARLRRRS